MRVLVVLVLVLGGLVGGTLPADGAVTRPPPRRPPIGAPGGTGWVDLVVPALPAPPVRVAPGASFAFPVGVRNTGTARATAAGVLVRLSTDAVPDRGDVVIGRGRTPVLAAGAAASLPLTVTVPAAQPLGTYRVVACVDEGRKVLERNDGNNCRVADQPVEVARTAPAPPDGPPVIRALSDTRVVPHAGPALEASMERTKPWLCWPGVASPPLTLDAAVANVTAFLRAQAGQGALDAFRASPHATTAAAANQAAITAAVGAEPGAALAALLRAHELAPTDPVALSNAAALLPQVGLANEAVAFAEAALALPATTRAPMGISAAATLRNNHGFALLSARRFDEARTVLAAAAAADPLLVEAQANLAMAELCAGDTPAAAKAYRRSVKRRPFDKGDLVEATTPPGERPRASKVYDTSHGVGITLPRLTIPPSPKAALAMWDPIGGWGGVMSTIQTARIDEHNARRNALLAEQAARPPAHPASQRRIRDLWAAVVDADTEPHLASLRAAFDGAVDDLDEATVEYIESMRLASETMPHGQFVDWCGGHTSSAHGRWRPLAAQVESTGRAYIEAYYRHTTGLAANIADPLEHELLMVHLAGNTDAMFFAGVVGTIARQVGAEHEWRYWCVTGSGTAQQTETTPAGGQPDACPPEIKAVALKVSFLEMIEVKGTCEKVEVEAAMSGPLAGFASVEYVYGTGQTTFFVGSKLSGAGSSLKTGVYVKGGETITDVGIRFAAEANIPAGPVEVKVGSSDTDFTFAGTIADPTSWR